MPDRTKWRNWAGTETASPTGVARPADTDEIAMLVAAAAGGGTRIRPVGSGHSFSGVGKPEGVQLSFDRFADLVRLDRETGLVTVQPGMTLRRLNRLLADAGLALAVLGDVDAQTVAGAISTGTHGTGAAFGGLSTLVTELELVLADGSVLTCSPSERPELFAA
nr:FAD-binding protein [Micromonospora sp. DSM 115978]